MWGDCREVCLGDMDVQIPCPEDMLIHLAVHSSCHGNTHLRWLYDIRLWLERFGREINVNRLADKCRRWQLALPVNRALMKVKQVLGASCGTTIKCGTGVSPVSCGTGVSPVFSSACDTGASPVHTQARRLCHKDNNILDATIRATDMLAGPMERLALAASPIGQDAPVLYTAANVLSTPGIRFRLGYLSAVLLPEPAHLAQLYPRRHPGWQLAAHAVRLSRCIKRSITTTPA
jgi:hypothetical protein